MWTFALLLSNPPVEASTGPDTTPVPIHAIGDAGASLSSGAWSHRVPLELPPAPSGSVPGTALVADFRVPDGPLGPGWRIDGLSRIERRSATNGTPRMDATDTFYVDGTRLYYNALTNSYRLEHDDNRVFTFDSAKNKWEVYRDGWNWRYGEFATGDTWRGICATETLQQSAAAPCEAQANWGDAIADGPSETTAWLLSRVRDPSSNDTLINYTSNAGFDQTGGLFDGEYAYQHMPDTMQYAGGHHALRFDYASRPDALVDGRSGRLRALVARLTGLQVLVNATTDPATEDTRYQLVYKDEDPALCPGEDAVDTGVDLEAQSVLHRIARLDTATSEARTIRCIETDDELPSLDGSGVSQELTMDEPDPGQVRSDVPAVVNFDGDAWPDLADWHMYCDDGDSIVCLGYITDYSTGEEFCYYNDTDCTVGLEYWDNADDGSGQLVAGTYDTSPIQMTVDEFAGDARWTWTDLNRDGATDAVIVRPDSGYYYASTWFGGPDGFSAEDTDAVQVDVSTLPELQDYSFVDVDGDGYTDVVLDDTKWIRNEGGPIYLDFTSTPLPITSPYADLLADYTCDPAPTMREVEIEGSGSLWLPTGLDQLGPTYADMNGDGLADMIVSTWPCWDLLAYEPEDDILSRIFYGDGTGTFHDTAVEAGLPFELGDPGYPEPLWEFTPAFSVVDLDHSGRVEILHAVDYDPIYTIDLGLAQDLGFPSGFGFTDGVLVCPHGTCEEPVIGAGPLTDRSVYGSDHQLLADWDADGFADLLQLDIGEEHTATLFRNQRSNSRHRITTIHDAWGGEIALTYTTSAHSGSSPALPYPLEVIASVDDEHGHTTFAFDGGYAWDGRFLSFESASIQYESGASASAKFAVQPALAGATVSRTTYRPDGTIDTFTWYQYLAQVPAGFWVLDQQAPYFNPIQRRCDALVGPGYASGGAIVQSVTEADLVEQCVEWEAGSLQFDALEWMAAFGWERDPPGATEAAEIADAVWDGSVELTFGDADGDLAGWRTFSLAFPGRDTYPLTVGLPNDFPRPSPPNPLSGGGDTTTVVEVFVEDWTYNSLQRMTEDINYRDITTSGDDITAVYDLDTWSNSARGQRVKGITWTHGSTEVRSVENSNFAAFDRPQMVVERGTGGFGSRTWEYTWDKGEATTVKDPDGALTSFTRNACGLPTVRTDPEGRVWTGDYDDACRLEGWTWEGASATIAYDGLGRMTSRTITPRAGSADPDQEETWIYDDQLDVIDDRLTWDEPRSARVLGDGTMRLNFLDPWGRPFLEMVCDSTAAAGTGVSAVFNARTCDGGTEVASFRAWSEDGQLRMTTPPYRLVDEVPATSWTWRDAFGRVELQDDPAPIVVATTLDAEWVQTSIDAWPGQTVVTDPAGHSCTTTYDTLGTDTTCEGAYRGGRTVDPLGWVVEEESADGVVTELGYDEFGHVTERRLASPILTYDVGSSDLAESWTWTAGGRLDSATDAAGNERSWTYDDLGRPLTASYTPYGGATTQVSAWTWHDYTAGLGRYVGMEDVNGNLTVTSLDGLDRAWKVRNPANRDAETHWDAAGRVASTTDIDGLTTLYTWTPEGTLAAVEEPVTSATRTWERDGAGRATAAVDRDGVATSYTYTWDGRPSEVRRVRTSEAAWTLAAWTWEDDGQLATAYQRGTTTTLAHDALHRRTGACVGWETGDGTGCGGITLGWDYDDADRVVESSRARASDTPFVTTYSYNDVGWRTGVVYPDTSTASWSYDRKGLLRAYEDEDNRDSTWSYDGWGRVFEETLPGQGTRTYSYTFGVGGHEVHEVEEPDGGIWTTWYDFAGRAVSSEQPDGVRVDRDFDGSRLAEVRHLDAGLNILAREAYTYDPLGHLETRWGPVDEATWQARSGVPTSGDTWYAYTSTDEGRTLTVEGPNDLTTFEWTDGVMTGEDIAGVTDILYTYDADYPRQSGAVVGGDRTLSRTWTRGLWLDTESWTQDGDVLERTFGDWDAFGQAREVSSLFNASAQVGYTYETDSRGRLAQVDTTIGSDTWSVTYGYTDAGRILTVAPDWTEGLSYSYLGDDLDEIRRLSDSSVLVSFDARDTLGRATDILLPGGKVTRSFDQVGRLATLDVENAANEVVTRTYGYDARGRLTTLDIGGDFGSETETWTYQEPGWLTEESDGTTTVSYTYDAAGNRLERDDGTVTTYEYDYGNRLNSVGGVSVTWDTYGGITEDHRGYTILRGPDGSEIGIDDASTALYDVLHDAYGRLVGVDDGSATTTTFWGNPGADLPLGAIDEDGSPVLNVAAEGMLLAQLRDGVATDAVTDLGGNLVLHDTDFLDLPGAFGDQSSVVDVGTAATERYVYADLQSLPDAPFQLARQRMYDPDTGRFTRMDPLGLAGGDNRFVYANDDPVGMWDPGGLKGESTNPGGPMRAPISREPFSRGCGGTDGPGGYGVLSEPKKGEPPEEPTKPSDDPGDGKRDVDPKKSSSKGKTLIDVDADHEWGERRLLRGCPGKPRVVTIRRSGANANRAASLSGIPKVPGKQLDEYPPAMFEEGGAGASVRPVEPSDNTGAGACIGNQCRGLPDGAKVKIEVE